MIIRPEAEADLADVQAWYETQQAGLGEEFLGCVGEALEGIEVMPERHRIIYRGYGVR